MQKNLIEGNGLLLEELKKCGKYIIVTMEEPFALISNNVKPFEIIFNYDMTEENLKRLASNRKDGELLVGFGGGTACDTAKYLSAKWNLPLIIAPSVVSVDAWLCRSVAVRFDHKVRYVENVETNKFIVDYDILKKSPAILNKAGVSDALSITTALGDWNIARSHFQDKYEQSYYDSAKKIADELLNCDENIRNHNEKGLRSIVKGQLLEVALCEEWGNSRPEEGGEHFLGYCLEELTHKHYIHGLLIALNIVVVLKLQRENAVYNYNKIYEFFKKIGLDISFKNQNITIDEYRNALLKTPDYVRREKLYNGIFSLPSVFDDRGEFSLNDIAEWASTL